MHAAKMPEQAGGHGREVRQGTETPATPEEPGSQAPPSPAAPDPQAPASPAAPGWQAPASPAAPDPQAPASPAASDWQAPASPVAPDPAALVIGILGGTGDQGRGLARRFAIAGHRVIIGSRAAERAAAAAAAMAGGLQVEGMANDAAVRLADIVIVAVPWDGHRELLAALAGDLAGKIVIDCVNPLGFDAHGCYPLAVAEGSAAEQAAAVLPDSRVVGAFHHVSAVLLLDSEVAELDLDVLVLGDDRQATDLVQALAGRIPGMRGVYAGRLRNCGQVEALTANLVSVNRRYKAHAGLRITDI